jgi:hypothetical protein
MAKASDLIGKSGGGGFGPIKPNPSIVPPAEKKEGADHSATRQKPVKGAKPQKGGHGGIGGTPTSVRPKV